jgi:hypothetical protein
MASFFACLIRWHVPVLWTWTIRKVVCDAFLYWLTIGGTWRPVHAMWTNDKFKKFDSYDLIMTIM